MDASIQRASERRNFLPILFPSHVICFADFSTFSTSLSFPRQEKSDGGKEARRTRESFMAPYFISFVDRRQG